GWRNRSVLLGEQAASKTAAQGSNPCAPADWPTWLDTERRRTRNADHAGANPVVGSWSRESGIGSRESGHPIPYSRFPTPSEMSSECGGGTRLCEGRRPGSIPG